MLSTGALLQTHGASMPSFGKNVRMQATMQTLVDGPKTASLQAEFICAAENPFQEIFNATRTSVPRTTVGSRSRDP